MCQPIAAHVSSPLASESTPLSIDSWRVYRLPPSTGNAVNGSKGEEYFFVARKELNIPEADALGAAALANLSNLVIMHLDNNRPCAVGLCRNGICVESQSQRVGRLWPLFLSTNAWSMLSLFCCYIFRLLMRSNVIKKPVGLRVKSLHPCLRP